jgi:hypothetical protein
MRRLLFLSDVDFLPSPHMLRTLKKHKRLLEETDEVKLALVVPAFEMVRDSYDDVGRLTLEQLVDEIPKTKAEVVRLAKQGKVRPFHETVYSEVRFSLSQSFSHSSTTDCKLQGHAPTKYEYWYVSFFVFKGFHSLK